MMKRFPGIRQQDETDCGPACLSSILSYHNRTFSIAQLRQWSGTDRLGTNLAGMIHAADRAGLAGRAVRAREHHLPDLSEPTIAHLTQTDGLHHFVVIVKFRRRTIRVMDPATGRVESWRCRDFLNQWSGVLLILEPSPDVEQPPNGPSRFQRWASLLVPHRTMLAQALTGAALFTLIGLSMAIFLQIIVDHIIPDARFGLLRLAGSVMILLLLLQTAIGAFKSLFVLKTGQWIDARLISGYYRHLLRLPQSFHDGMQKGELISRLNDAVKIRLFINDVAVQLAVNLFIILFSLALLLTTYWKLGLFLLLLIPCYTLLYAIVNRWNRQTLRETMEQSANLESRLIESLRSIRTVKIFGIEEQQTDQTERVMARLLQCVYQSGLHHLFAGASTRFISTLFTIGTLWLGTASVLNGDLTAGELLSFYAVIGYFTGPAAELTTANRTIQDASIASDRLFELLDIESETGPDHPLPPDPDARPICLDRVTFRYGHYPPVLQNCSLTANRGEITAIAGESGCGKSTLFSLLQGLYRIEDGDLRVMGRTIEELGSKSLCSHLTVVPQESHLFSGTLLENIALGDSDPDLNRILQLFKRLELQSLLAQLPEGLETRLGEDGRALSGGQRQKVAVARALYREPSILLLDEATSSLDLKSEEVILDAVRTWCTPERTVVMISHQKRALRIADRIHWLENGSIVHSEVRNEIQTSKDT